MSKKILTYIILTLSTLSTVASSESRQDSVADVSAAIKYLLKTGSYKRALAPGEPEELAEAFIQAAAEYKLPVYLLVVIGYRESVFRDLTGDGGRSLGIMQVGRQGRAVCNCSMSSKESQITCGACWLAAGLKWCKSIRGAVSAYAGGQCKPQSPRVKWLVDSRLKTYKKLEAKPWL